MEMINDLTISMNNTQISEVSNIKFNGIIIDNKCMNLVQITSNYVYRNFYVTTFIC